MQVILIQDVNNLGGANELVTVKNGYVAACRRRRG